MIRVTASIGIGAWKVSKTVNLVACPHVGDTIEVDGITVTCERVHLMEAEVLVEETIRFASEDDLQEYVDSGWSR